MGFLRKTLLPVLLLSSIFFSASVLAQVEHACSYVDETSGTYDGDTFTQTDGMDCECACYENLKWTEIQNVWRDLLKVPYPWDIRGLAEVEYQQTGETAEDFYSQMVSERFKEYKDVVLPTATGEIMPVQAAESRIDESNSCFLKNASFHGGVTFGALLRDDLALGLAPVPGLNRAPFSCANFPNLTETSYLEDLAYQCYGTDDAGFNACQDTTGIAYEACQAAMIRDVQAGRYAGGDWWQNFTGATDVVTDSDAAWYEYESSNFVKNILVPTGEEGPINGSGLIVGTTTASNAGCGNDPEVTCSFVDSDEVVCFPKKKGASPADDDELKRCGPEGDDINMLGGLIQEEHGPLSAFTTVFAYQIPEKEKGTFPTLYLPTNRISSKSVYFTLNNADQVMIFPRYLYIAMRIIKAWSRALFYSDMAALLVPIGASTVGKLRNMRSGVSGAAALQGAKDARIGVWASDFTMMDDAARVGNMDEVGKQSLFLMQKAEGSQIRGISSITDTNEFSRLFSNADYADDLSKSALSSSGRLKMFSGGQDEIARALQQTDLDDVAAVWKFTPGTKWDDLADFEKREILSRAVMNKARMGMADWSTPALSQMATSPQSGIDNALEDMLKLAGEEPDSLFRIKAPLSTMPGDTGQARELLQIRESGGRIAHKLGPGVSGRYEELASMWDDVQRLKKNFENPADLAKLVESKLLARGWDSAAASRAAETAAGGGANLYDFAIKGSIHEVSRVGLPAERASLIGKIGQCAGAGGGGCGSIVVTEKLAQEAADANALGRSLGSSVDVGGVHGSLVSKAGPAGGGRYGPAGMFGRTQIFNAKRWVYWIYKTMFGGKLSMYRMNLIVFGAATVNMMSQTGAFKFDHDFYGSPLNIYLDWENIESKVPEYDYDESQKEALRDEMKYACAYFLPKHNKKLKYLADSFDFDLLMDIFGIDTNHVEEEKVYQPGDLYYFQEPSVIGNSFTLASDGHVTIYHTAGEGFRIRSYANYSDNFYIFEHPGTYKDEQTSMAMYLSQVPMSVILNLNDAMGGAVNTKYENLVPAGSGLLQLISYGGYGWPRSIMFARSASTASFVLGAGRGMGFIGSLFFFHFLRQGIGDMANSTAEYALKKQDDFMGSITEACTYESGCVDLHTEVQAAVLLKLCSTMDFQAFGLVTAGTGGLGATVMIAVPIICGVADMFVSEDLQKKTGICMQNLMTCPYRYNYVLAYQELDPSATETAGGGLESMISPITNLMGGINGSSLLESMGGEGSDSLSALLGQVGRNIMHASGKLTGRHQVSIKTDEMSSLKLQNTEMYWYLKSFEDTDCNLKFCRDIDGRYSCYKVGEDLNGQLFLKSPVDGSSLITGEELGFIKLSQTLKDFTETGYTHIPQVFGIPMGVDTGSSSVLLTIENGARYGNKGGVKWEISESDSPCFYRAMRKLRGYNETVLTNFGITSVSDMEPVFASTIGALKYLETDKIILQPAPEYDGFSIIGKESFDYNTFLKADSDDPAYVQVLNTGEVQIVYKKGMCMSGEDGFSETNTASGTDGWYTTEEMGTLSAAIFVEDPNIPDQRVKAAMKYDEDENRLWIAVYEPMAELAVKTLVLEGTLSPNKVSGSITNEVPGGDPCVSVEAGDMNCEAILDDLEETEDSIEEIETFTAYLGGKGVDVSFVGNQTEELRDEIGDCRVACAQSIDVNENCQISSRVSALNRIVDTLLTQGMDNLSEIDYAREYIELLKSLNESQDAKYLQELLDSVEAARLAAEAAEADLTIDNIRALHDRLMSSLDEVWAEDPDSARDILLKIINGYKVLRSVYGNTVPTVAKWDQVTNDLSTAETFARANTFVSAKDALRNARDRIFEMISDTSFEKPVLGDVKTVLLEGLNQVMDFTTARMMYYEALENTPLFDNITVELNTDVKNDTTVDFGKSKQMLLAQLDAIEAVLDQMEAFSLTPMQRELVSNLRLQAISLKELIVELEAPYDQNEHKLLQKYADQVQQVWDVIHKSLIPTLNPEDQAAVYMTELNAMKKLVEYLCGDLQYTINTGVCTPNFMGKLEDAYKVFADSNAGMNELLKAMSNQLGQSTQAISLEENKVLPSGVQFDWYDLLGAKPEDLEEEGTEGDLARYAQYLNSLGPMGKIDTDTHSIVIDGNLVKVYDKQGNLVGAYPFNPQTGEVTVDGVPYNFTVEVGPDGDTMVTMDQVIQNEGVTSMASPYGGGVIIPAGGGWQSASGMWMPMNPALTSGLDFMAIQGGGLYGVASSPFVAGVGSQGAFVPATSPTSPFAALPSAPETLEGRVLFALLLCLTAFLLRKKAF